jgi:repressor LexA
MKEIAVNLKKVLREKGLSQKDLSELTELSTSAISDYVNAKTLMAPSILQIVAGALKVKASDINSALKSVDSTSVDLEIVNIPVVGKISCGNGSVVFEEIEGYEATPKDWTAGGDFFYLRAKGDSMIGARIFDGDLLLIRKQPEVEDGEIAAVLIDDESVLKKVYFRDGTIILQSENQAYPPLMYSLKDKNVKIIGKLKKNVIDY